jgi:zinc/manganese transport system substrate-binding protein
VAGNPHIHTDPRNLIRVAKTLAERLTRLDPAQTQVFQDNLYQFEQEWKQSLRGWKQKAAPLRGMPVAVLRNSWPYMVDWLKLKQVITLEQKPGVPPTSKHLVSILERVKHQPVKAILYASNQSPKAVNWLSDKTSIPSLELPFTVGGNDKASDLFSLYENTIDLLLQINQLEAEQ